MQFAWYLNPFSKQDMDLRKYLISITKDAICMSLSFWSTHEIMNKQRCRLNTWPNITVYDFAKQHHYKFTQIDHYIG